VASEKLASDEEELQKLLVEQRLYEGSARTLQERLEMVSAALRESAVAQATLQGIKTQKTDADALIPVGAGSYVRTKLADTSKIVMGVGAGVAVEKPIDDSINVIKDRITSLDKARTTIEEQLNQTLNRIEQNRESLNVIVRKHGGESITTV
jgi:prefoldin alpha subunit